MVLSRAHLHRKIFAGLLPVENILYTAFLLAQHFVDVRGCLHRPSAGLRCRASPQASASPRRGFTAGSGAPTTVGLCLRSLPTRGLLPLDRSPTRTAAHKRAAHTRVARLAHTPPRRWCAKPRISGHVRGGCGSAGARLMILADVRPPCWVWTPSGCEANICRLCFAKLMSAYFCP